MLKQVYMMEQLLFYTVLCLILQSLLRLAVLG
jgi:hypothetical protein